MILDESVFQHGWEHNIYYVLVFYTFASAALSMVRIP